MRASLRLAVLAAITASTTIGAIACVGDDPTSAGGDTNGSDGGSDSTTTSDGAIGSDGSPPGDGSTSDAGPCAGETGCPAGVGGGHLQLWLRGDKGLDCPAFRVTTWHDQSGHGRDATAALNPDGGPALAPQCGVKTINSLPVPSFTDPPPAGGTAFDPSADETFRVDLGFLKNHEFTVAVVHEEAAYIFSSALLAFAVLPPPSCPTGQPSNAGGFALGLEHDLNDAATYYQSDIQCAGDTSHGYRAPTTMQTQLVEYTFDNATGYHIFVDGVETTLSPISNLDASAANLIGVTADGGESSLIGRLPSTLNTRYKGNIAEIVAYDSALSPADRFVVETYLKVKWSVPF